MDLSLVLEPNSKGHGDLVLRFAGEVYLADSYYLALDSMLIPEREDEAKVRAVLRRLLERWREAVVALEPGGEAFVPYDFSDECSAWLRLRRHPGETFSIERGWSAVEGWSFSPSDSSTWKTPPPGFAKEGPSLVTSLPEVLAAIDRSLDATSSTPVR